MNLLEKFGLSYEDLNTVEKETYVAWLNDWENKKLDIADVRNYIVAMKNAVAMELADTPYNDKDKGRILKARLKNYILLEAFLTAPEKARERLEATVKSLAKNKSLTSDK